jgi:hypothetical protein
LKAPSAFSKFIRVAIGIQVVVKLSNFYVQEKDKNTLGRTKRERDRECVRTHFWRNSSAKWSFFFFKMAKESAYGFVYSPTFGNFFFSKNHEN